MRKNKKIVLIILVFVIFSFFYINRSEKVQKISENAREETFQTNENVEEKCYEDGKALIFYNSDNFFTNLKVKTNALFSEYKIEETVKFEEICVEDSSKGNQNEKINLAIATIASNKYSTDELIEKLEEKNWVISAIPNYQFKTTGLTSDEYSNIQWALQNEGQFAGTIDNDINPITTSSEKEKVIAIVDSGVNYKHEDLANIMWENPYNDNKLPGKHGYDFFNNDNDPDDDLGHGTHCAGIVAAEANNGIGISGAALGASNIKIMALKVGDATGSIDLNSIIKAYNYIVEAQKLGINIVAINNSWGAVIQITSNQEKGLQSLKDTFEQIVNNVGQNGALSVFSAGNEGLDLDKNGVYTQGENKYLAFPACLESDYEITVAAINSNDELGYFSNYGDVVEIAAPGVEIVSTYKSNKAFNPTSKDRDNYSIYEDFEDVSSEILNKFTPYISVKNGSTYQLKDASSICSLELSDERFSGEIGKSLKMSVDNSNRNSTIVLRLPLSEFGITNYETYAISLDVYAEQDTNGAGYKSAGTGFVYNGKYTIYLRNEPGVGAYYSAGPVNIYESDYWHHMSFVCLQKQYTPFEHLDIELSSLGTGEYTIYLDNLVITKDLGNDYMNIFTPYELQSGTSMAAPYVTASVAVASNANEDYDELQIKELILNEARNVEKIEELVQYGTLDMNSFIQPEEMVIVYEDTCFNYDGKEHSINFTVEEPTSEYEIYYSIEQELTNENYIIGNKELPTFVDSGEYTVYWYVHSTDEKYIDKFGECKVVIEKKDVTITANNQKILKWHEIKKGLEYITIGDDGLVEGQVLSEITIESLVGSSNEEIIRPSNAKIKDNSNNDVTSNYNINYINGKLTRYSEDEIVEVKFNDENLYKIISDSQKQYILYKDEENTNLIFEKTSIEKIENISLDDSCGKITDLTGVSKFYNLKNLDIKNIQIVNVEEISKILELTKIAHVKVEESRDVSEMECTGAKMFLTPFLQLTAQTQENVKITAYTYYSENNKEELPVNKDENGKLYVILDNNISENKPAGQRNVEFKVNGGLTNDSKFTVLYNVEAPLTNFETISIGDEEYILLIDEKNNSVNDILTQENFPNINYNVRAVGIDGNILTNTDKIGTGTKIEILNTVGIVKKYVISLKGDIDCNGKTNLYDILRLIELVYDTDSSYVWNESIRMAGKCVEDSITNNPGLYDILRLIEYYFDNVEW